MGDGYEIMTLSPCPIGPPAPPPQFSPGVNPATVGDFRLRHGPSRPWAAGPLAGCPSPGDFRFRIVDFGLLNFDVQNSGTHWVFEIRTWRLGPSPWSRPPHPPKGYPAGTRLPALPPGGVRPGASLSALGSRLSALPLPVFHLTAPGVASILPFASDNPEGWRVAPPSHGRD